VDQILKATNKEIFFVPGEHDVLNDEGAMFRERYAKNSKGQGWYSFDKNGVHFVGLVNVMNLKAGGLGTLGSEQLEWLEDDVKHLSTARPLWSLRTFHSGRSTRNGDGGPTTARRRFRT
jgi:3',5'-cyclic-AMP phosphodiesterase